MSAEDDAKRAERARENQRIRNLNPGCTFPTCFCRAKCAIKEGTNPNAGRIIAPWETGGVFGVIEE